MRNELELDPVARRNLDKILKKVRELRKANSKRRRKRKAVGTQTNVIRLTDKESNDLMDYLFDNFDCLGEGIARSGFGLSKKWVLKFESGRVKHNKAEAELYKKSPENKAPCKLVRNHPYLLLMRRVKQVNEYDISDRMYEKHSWLDNLIDWAQVGYLVGTRKFVCFDYASPTGNGEKRI